MPSLSRCKSAPSGAMAKAPPPKVGARRASARCLRAPILPKKKGPRPPLLRLPVEVLGVALAFLPRAQQLRFAAVCREGRRLAYQPALWTALALPACVDPERLAHLPPRCPALTALDLSRCRALPDGLLVQFAEHCRDLRRVNLSCCTEVTDAAVLALVSCCPRLTVLTLEGCTRLTDAAFAALRRLRDLTYLNASFCTAASPEAIGAAFTDPRTALVDLNLDGCSQLVDPTVVQICGSSRALTCLHLDGEFLTDRSAECIGQGLPGLQLLHISFCTALTDASLRALQHCPNLISLRLKKGNGFSAAGLFAFFAAHPWEKLCALDLTDCQRMDDEVCEQLAASCPNLLRLNVSWCWHVSDVGLTALTAGLPLLTQLDLCGLKKLSNVAVAKIPLRLRFLNFLSLTQCNGISDQVVRLLVECMPGVTVLDYYDAPHGNVRGRFMM